MDRYIREQEAEISCHVWDWMRSPAYREDMEMIEQAASPFRVGDTVRIVGPMYTGQVGELVVIDPENIESCDFFCVYLDSVEKVVPFAADELERVEPESVCEMCGGLGEVREYPTGLYSLPAWKWVPCPACSEL